ncbi:TonB family protein [Mucilaginibacter sp.]
MNWLHYLLEANLYLALFYLAYCLFLKRDTHYRLKRIYLIFSCIISFILPVLQVSALRPVKPAEPINTIAYTSLPVQNIKVIPSEIPIVTPTTAPVIKHNFTLQDGLWYVYLAGVIVLLFSFFVKMYSLVRLVYNKQSVKEGKHRVVYLSGTSTAFSFFNYLFIGTNTNGADTIIRHELVHIRQKHSMDILFLELLKIINWFSPFIYLLQNSLKTVHEYIADEQTAAHETDALTYSSFLVMNAYGTEGLPITNSFFNYNLLKKRIIMLNQQRSGNLARLKYLVAIPICVALLSASTLAFSKTYGWVDLTPAKFKSDSRYAMLNASLTAKRKLLKITKNGVVTISNQLSVDVKNKKVVYTAATITQTDRSSLLKDQHIKVEVVVDSSQFKTMDGRLILPIVNADGYYMMDHFLHNNIHYPSAKGEKGGLVEVSFSLDNDRQITDLQIVKSGGAKLDALALNGFKNYKGIVNDDAGKTLKIGVYFFTDDYSIFKTDSLGKDPEFAGELIITNYKYPVSVTSKGYEYDENGLGFKGVKNAPSAKVVIYEKNGEAKWFYENKLTAADQQLLKEKYGYTFPSGSANVMQMMTLKNVDNKRLAYIFDVKSYLDAPYSDQFYNYVVNNIQYPVQAQKALNGGVVILNFNLGNDGMIGDVQVAQSAGSGFDEAAVNALQSYKSAIKDNAGKHSIAVVFCVAEKKYRPVVSDKFKKDGYVGELAVSDGKSIFSN